MPYVDPADANNWDSDTIAAIRARNGTGNWREKIAASPRQRVVLLHWPPGTVQPAHYHPNTEETLVIHAGYAEFTMDTDRVTRAEPGSILFAPRGCRHGVHVVGGEPLLMMCFLAPNIPNDEILA